MKKIKYLAFYLISSSLLPASISITASADSILDASSDAVVAGRLAILVVSTGDSVFGPIVEGSININNTDAGAGFLDGTDDAIIQHFSTTVNGFSGNAEAASGSVSLNLDSRFSAGDSFAIYWFPTVVYDADISTIALSAGDSYGLVSSGNVQDDGTGINGVKDWVLPADTNSPIYANLSAGAALLSVQAVPEPTSTALLGLGVFGLIARRRRA